MFSISGVIFQKLPRSTYSRLMKVKTNQLRTKLCHIIGYWLKAFEHIAPPLQYGDGMSSMDVAMHDLWTYAWHSMDNILLDEWNTFRYFSEFYWIRWWHHIWITGELPKWIFWYTEAGQNVRPKNTNIRQMRNLYFFRERK